MADFSQKYKALSWYLFFSAFVYLQGALLFGIDTGSFGSLQALPSFLGTFGRYDHVKQKYILPSSIKAAMNSIPFAGQAIGAFLSESTADYFGYKLSLVIVSLIQLVAVVISLTSNLTSSWGQFTAGRFIAYISTGIAEMVVTNYLAEISPAQTRGLISGSMVLFNALGNFWGTGMSRAFSTETHPKGWLIPQAVQMIPAVIALALVWFTPESPRWLVMKNKQERAARELRRLRPNESARTINQQIEALELSIQEAGGHEKLPWTNLVKGNMLRRTWIACTLFICMQFSGVQFINSYGATFYVEYGLGANSFTYITIGNSLQVATCLLIIFLFDICGRRYFTIATGSIGFILLAIIAGVGSSKSRSKANINTVVASIILLQIFTRWAVSIAFVVSAEIGGAKMRKKLMAICGVVNMFAAILITSVLPYLMDKVPGSAGLGARVGWFFAGSNVILMLFGIFLVPELKGRSLEETDELFDAGLVWGWQFSKYKTTGAGARIAALEMREDGQLSDTSSTHKC